jgi:hypothetical protein
MYVLASLSKLSSTHFSDRGFNLVLEVFGMWAKVGKPKICKWIMEGFLPEKNSFDVMAGCRFVDRRFNMMLAALTGPAQRCPGKVLSSRRHRVM